MAAEGLVVINVHRGTFIVQPTKDDVEEIYSLREALESLAVKRVIEIASDEEIEGLFETAKQFTAASSQKKVAQLVGTNMALHGELFKLLDTSAFPRYGPLWNPSFASAILSNSSVGTKIRNGRSMST